MDELFDVTVKDAVARIRSLDPEVHMFINTRLDEALEEKRRLRVETPRSKLHGIPFGLKDEFDTCCLPTTAGSWMFRDRIPQTDSSVYKVFTDAGAVLVGKSNLCDLGVGSESSNYVGGISRNPFDRKRTSGGSSGGSAAAVANGCVGFDWGADMGGSIRVPAAFCGVLGMRLSHEIWPIKELFPRLPSAIERITGQGPFTKTTDQMRAVLEVAATRLRTGDDSFFKVRGAVIYPPDRGLWPNFAEDVKPHLEVSIDGPMKINDSLDKPGKMFAAYASILASHLEDLLAFNKELRFTTAVSAALSGLLFRGFFGDKRMHRTTAAILLQMALGRITLYRDKSKAKARALSVQNGFQKLWDQGRIVVAPVTPYPPPCIRREKIQLARYLNSNLISCTVAGNLADATCIAIPFGTFNGRLPRAIQLMGPPGSEQALLSVTDRLIASRDRDPRLVQPIISVK